MECPVCGALLPDDAAFCPECGSPVTVDASSFRPDYHSESPIESEAAPATDGADPYTTPQTVTQSPSYSYREDEAATEETVKLPDSDAYQPESSFDSSMDEAAADTTCVQSDPLSGFGTTIEDAVTEPAFHADTTPLTEEEQLT